MDKSAIIHLVLQTIAIVLWLNVIRIGVRHFPLVRKSKLNPVKWSIIALTLSSGFVAYNLYLELAINNYKSGSSMWLWYPCNYVLSLGFILFIRAIDELIERNQFLRKELKSKQDGCTN